MKIFVDSANIEEIEKLIPYVDGVTTNPTLIKEAMKNFKTKVKMDEYIEKICKVVGKGKPVSLEVISLTKEKMIKEAEILFNRFNKIANNVVIKIPINTYDGTTQKNHYIGLDVIKELNSKDIPVNATLIMTPEQAILAAKAGASFASPFTGRIDDFIRKNVGMNFQK